jgi:thiol-disulfide isomerase/thioredoxin
MPLRKWLRVGLLAAAVFLIIAEFSSPSLTESGNAIPVKKRKTLPDFTYREIDGRPWRLSDQRGKVVFLNFWAPWCPPCRAETPGLERVYQQLRSEGLTIAGIDVDGEAAAAASFSKQFGVDYALLLPSPGSPLTDQVESLPTSLLLDRDGRVARTYVGAVSESTLAADVNAVLKEPRGTPPNA